LTDDDEEEEEEAVRLCAQSSTMIIPVSVGGRRYKRNAVARRDVRQNIAKEAVAGSKSGRM
jgi:hypothetical protein